MPLGINKVALFGAAADTGTGILLETVTTSGAASIEFTSGITDAYKHYVFSFIAVAPITDVQEIRFITSTDGGSSYGVSSTSTFFNAYQHIIWDTTTAISYDTSRDVASSTSAIPLTATVAKADQSAGGNNVPGANMSGELHLFNPASTTYVKNFQSRCTANYHLAGTYDYYVAGFSDTTSAINAVKFDAASGNIQGTVKMWGIK